MAGTFEFAVVVSYALGTMELDRSLYSIESGEVFLDRSTGVRLGAGLWVRLAVYFHVEKRDDVIIEK